jgi:hypothetical protein
MADVAAYHLVLGFVAGLLAAVLFTEGIVRPRRQRKALIWRRLLS